MLQKNKIQQLLQDNRTYPRQYCSNIAAQEATIWLYDVIGESAWGGIGAAQFVKDLAAISAPVIHLRINSPGGDVFDARAMVTAIKQHPAQIITHIDGLAASAASYIALAGDAVEMSDGAFLMIHNSWGLVIGNRHDLLDMAATLEKIDASILADYHEKTGNDKAQIADWMDRETWFTAQEALDARFVDRLAVSEEKQAQQRWDVSAYVHPPDAFTRTDYGLYDRLRRVEVIEKAN
ncbi:MAG: head maturation protease, ClpP-related [Micavibrio sp.]